MLRQAKVITNDNFIVRERRGGQGPAIHLNRLCASIHGTAAVVAAKRHHSGPGATVQRKIVLS